MAENLSIALRVEQMERRQRREWPLVRSNYDAVDNALMRDVWLGESLVVLQFNPQRRASASASLDAASLAARPCFLCRDHQPVEQEALEWGGGEYKIQVNPYPIFSRHLTISLTTHSPQSMANPQRVVDMLSLARDLPDYVLFYNGPLCGASAPHHFHFQAALKGVMPLCGEVMNPAVWPEESQLEGTDDGFIGFSKHSGRFLFMIKSVQPVQAALYFARLQVAMMQATGVVAEPMQNILCWAQGDELYLVVFPRRKHRPACYGTGPGQLLVSPGSTEMGGLWALAERKDFDTITADVLQRLYDEICIDNHMAVRMIECFQQEKFQKES